MAASILDQYNLCISIRYAMITYIFARPSFKIYNSSDGTDLSRGMAQPTTGIKVPTPVITNTTIARCQSDTPFCNKHKVGEQLQLVHGNVTAVIPLTILCSEGFLKIRYILPILAKIVPKARQKAKLPKNP